MTNKFAVTYTIDHIHRVVVGVTAQDAETAKQLASEAFDEGTIWDDTEDMPLLFDDFEEVEHETLSFAAEEVSEFPAPDSSVTDLVKKANGFYACQALLAGEVGRAIQLAKKAVPFVADSVKEPSTWDVTSDNGCDPFQVASDSFEDALRDALYAIGWSVTLN